jgi:UDP:flavonoid glycosyltransferase YjiC (YdhE family)
MLFTTNPLYGHLYPMLPLMNAARQAGHEVIVATGADFAGEVSRHGFPVWVVGPTAPQVHAAAAAADEPPPADEIQGMVRAGMNLFGRPGIARARDLTPLAASTQPDVVVHELTEAAGWQAAAVSGALDVIHGFGTHIPNLIEAMQIVLSAVRSELGSTDRSLHLTDVPYVDPCPPLLQPPGGVPFRNVLPLRPEMGIVHPGEQLPEAMRDLPYQKTIYLTFGTAFNVPQVLAQAIDAVRDLQVNAIVTTGPGVDPASFDPVPPHLAIAQFVPQTLIMKRCAAVVSHTGSGTMLGALAEGLPQVCLPMGADQFSNAAQIARTRAGIVVPPDGRTPQTIRSAIEQVLADPGYAAGARVLQADIAAMPSAADVVNDITGLAAAKGDAIKKA